MSHEEVNRLTASFFRQAFYMKMLNIEHEYFLKQSTHSGIKNVLKRLKDSFATGTQQLCIYLPNSRAKFIETMSQSDEKIRAMANIIEKISMLDEADVLKLEKDFDELINVVY